MFHVADLRAAAQPPGWMPPATDPVEAILRRVRGRKWSTNVQGIGDLTFADEVAALAGLANVLESTCGDDPARLAAASAALLSPRGVLPGAMDAITRER